HISQDDYWEVTDGWDGVGILMYRLLARQVCTHERPAYIVLPVGTGDLFCGFFLGRQDAIDANEITEEDCRIVAVIPRGNSIRRNYAELGLTLDVCESRER